MDLRVFLKLDGSGFQQGLTQARAAVGRFSDQAFGGLKSQIAAAFTVGALVQFSRKTIDFAGHMRDLSDTLGVNVEWLQKMRNAAIQAGASEDDLARFIQAVGLARQNAIEDPGGAKAGAFQRMGMSKGDITGLSQQAFIDKLARQFASGALSLQAENDLIDVGGKAAKKLVGTLAQGIAEGGPIMPEKLVDELDELGDSFSIFSTILMDELAPGIMFASKAVMNWVQELKTGLGTIPGAVTAEWTSPKNAEGGLPNRYANIWKRFKSGWSEAQRQVASQDADWLDLMDQIEIAASKRRANRKARENAPPGFKVVAKKAEEVKPAETAKARIPSDSLVSVGNFLGGTSGLDRIVNATLEQNNIMRQQLAVMNQMNAAMKTAFSGIGSIVVP